jgi:hypothetical protein
LETLKTFKEVEALALGGSNACTCSDRYSDVDIYVFFRKKLTNESLREKAFTGIADFEKLYVRGIMDYFVINEKHIHTWWADLDDIEQKLKKNPEDIGAKTIIKYTKLVWDPKGKIKSLRKEIKYPSKLTKQVVVRGLILKSTPKIFRELAEKSIKRDRIYFAEWSIHKETENIIRAIYALNKKFYGNYPQHLKCDFSRFKIVPKNAYNNINMIGRYSLIDNPREKLTALFELYWSTLELVKTKYRFSNGDVFPEYGDKNWYKRRIKEITRMVNKIK